MTTSPRPVSRAFRGPLRLLQSHPRLLGSMAIAAVTYAALQAVELPQFAAAPRSTRLLLAWDAGVSIYLALAWSAFSRFDVDVVRRRAALQDDGARALLLLTAAAAIASLAAIVTELAAVREEQSPTAYFVLAVVTVVLSWTFVHSLFAVHYAHEYWDETTGGGLQFPGNERPDYWDFVYFSFVIGMTFQVSDVQVTSKALRRLVVLHGIVSFVFNVAILALVVNLGANLI